MNIQINKRRSKNILIYALLFLCSMNFEAKFHYFVYGLFMILILSQQANLLVTHGSLAYLALGVLMSLYCIDEGILSMLRCFSPFMMYELGFNLTVQNKRSLKENYGTENSTESFVYALIVSVCAGSFSHYLLNAVTNIGNIIGRNTIDVWSDEIMGATGQACLACLMLGLAVALIFKPLKAYQRYLGIACIIAALAYNLVLSGRSIIVVLAVLFFVSLLYINKIEKNFNKKLSLFIKIILALLAVLLIFAFNVFGVRNLLMQSNFVERFTEVLNFWDNSAREEAKLQFILHGWQYPFGGNHLLEQYGYAHDLLLDGYDEFGLLAFILLVLILSFGISSLIALLKRPRYSHELKFALLCVYVAILLIFLVEPILAGMAWLFVIYCFINGFMDGMRDADRLNGSMPLTKEKIS